MLTYIKVTIENDPHVGSVRIKSTAIKDDIGDVASVVVSRKEVNGSKWNDISTIKVTSEEDFEFEFLDVLTLAGKTYDYNIELMPASGIVPVEFGMIEGIKCTFDGLFVGNLDKQFVAQSNFKTETNQNTAVEYVTTLSGRYPYRVSNADTNYTSGTSNGLFLEVSEDKKRLIPDTNHAHANALIAFLSDGTNKLLKTHDGQAWFVSINANPNKIYSDFIGMNAVQFGWTQIGDLPVNLDDAGWLY